MYTTTNEKGNRDRYKDSETVDEFYAKLSDIVNSTFNLGEKKCQNPRL